MKTLKDTVDLMLSDDWRDRLRAEIYQCQIRKNRLQAILETLPKSDASYDMLQSQYIHMIDYLVDLQSRAGAFGIELDSEFEEDPMSQCCCCKPNDCNTNNVADMIDYLVAMDILFGDRGEKK